MGEDKIERTSAVDHVKLRPKPYQKEGKRFEDDVLTPFERETPEEFEGRKRNIQTEVKEAARILKEDVHINPFSDVRTKTIEEGREIEEVKVQHPDNGMIIVGGDLHIPIADPEGIAAAAVQPQKFFVGAVDVISRSRLFKGLNREKKMVGQRATGALF